MPETDVLEREDNEALIAEMVRRAETGEEPGDMRVNDVIHRGNEDFPSPIVTSKITSAGYAVIYDTKTGQPSLTNKNMLSTQFKKVHPDGTPAFHYKPLVEPKVGTVKCLLHPDAPDRERFDEMGFPTCTKSNLLNNFQRDRHMARRHKEEWASILEERKEREKEEDRAFQRKLSTDLHRQIKAAKSKAS